LTQKLFLEGGLFFQSNKNVLRTKLECFFAEISKKGVPNNFANFSPSVVGTSLNT